MNDLESRLCKSVRKSFDTYLFLAGEWLSHAPEHFIQNFLFTDIGRDEWMYLEATRKKIMASEDRPRLGRPPTAALQRFDLVSWNKASNTLRAVIEIKKCWQQTPGLRRDAERIKKAISGKYGARAGYLIAYSETKLGKSRTLEEKFADWSVDLDLHFLNKRDFHLRTYENWSAGFALFRA